MAMNNEISIYYQLGKRISYLRKQKKMSQLDLAISSEISPTYLNDLEHGRRNPSLKILSNVSDALGIKLEELFKGISSVDL